MLYTPYCARPWPACLAPCFETDAPTFEADYGTMANVPSGRTKAVGRPLAAPAVPRAMSVGCRPVTLGLSELCGPGQQTPSYAAHCTLPSRVQTSRMLPLLFVTIVG